MDAELLKQLENKLWDAADQLRANSKLTASEYSFPVLGLIFLRHSYERFISAEARIKSKLVEHPQRGYRKILKEDFTQIKAMYLPESAHWKRLVELPEGKNIGDELNEAMRAIEIEYPNLTGVLPKEYNIFDKALLQSIVRIFNDEKLDLSQGDMFGRIYEYFLNKFAMAGAQEGGEFFTPPSLVNTIVNIIEPKSGKVLDPACGSGGMFVQTGHFLEEEGEKPSEKVVFYGQEKADMNTRLAKMNMTVHGLDAKIKQGNTFYKDNFNLVGECSYVMANPPFNVDKVDKGTDFVKKDKRLPFGLPNNDNANYLWIQYFYAYLNETGRAGFVMASSASDAGYSERDIRRDLVKTGAVDVMVAIGPKFFYTRGLPCTIWFYDRAKEDDEVRKEETLMLDLRETYRKVSSNLHDFTPEHLLNIKAVTALYRGNNKPLQVTQELYTQKAALALNTATETLKLWYEKTTFEKGEPAIDSKKLPATLDIEKIKVQKRIINQAWKKLEAELKDYLRSEDMKKEKERKKEIREQIKEIVEITKYFNTACDDYRYFVQEKKWLTDRFPDAVYMDVPGLCKVVSRDEIADNDYSLTPGRYVETVSQIDENFDYATRMTEIKTELKKLDAKSVKFAKSIQTNLEELGI